MGSITGGGAPDGNLWTSGPSGGLNGRAPCGGGPLKLPETRYGQKHPHSKDRVANPTP
jgi:hypothetical protein